MSDREINAKIDDGVASYEGLQCHLGVGTQCGSCSCEVKDLLQAKQARYQQATGKAFAKQQSILTNMIATP